MKAGIGATAGEMTVTLAGGKEIKSSLALLEAGPHLLAAMKELNNLYTHFWDLVDGGVIVLPPSMPRFEEAFFRARRAIAMAEGRLAEFDEQVAAEEAE